MRYNSKQLKEIKESNYDLFEPANIFPELAPSGPSVQTPTEPVLPEVAISIEEISVEAKPVRELPSDAELYEIFDRLNQKLFNNQIPPLTVKYSKRMLIAGSYHPTSQEIKIGWKYHQIFRDDIEDTMAHEMIHYFYPNHGRKFKEMADRLGVSLKAKEHPDLRQTCRYIYYCPSCGKEYPRRKRLRMASCGKCTTGRNFDARFKLRPRKK